MTGLTTCLVFADPRTGVPEEPTLTPTQSPSPKCPYVLATLPMLCPTSVGRLGPWRRPAAGVVRQPTHLRFSLEPCSQLAASGGWQRRLVGLSPQRNKGSKARWRPHAVLDPKWAKTSCIPPRCVKLLMVPDEQSDPAPLFPPWPGSQEWRQPGSPSLGPILKSRSTGCRRSAGQASGPRKAEGPLRSVLCVSHWDTTSFQAFSRS